MTGGVTAFLSSCVPLLSLPSAIVIIISNITLNITAVIVLAYDACYYSWTFSLWRALSPCVYIYIYDAGLPHPPSPPPHPVVSPLACQVGSCLVWPCCFPSCLASSPPPPVEWGLWSFWLAPPRLWAAVCSTEVLQRYGMVAAAC